MSVRGAYIPKRGDLVWLDFNPASGHEQNGKRPAIVISELVFNKMVRLALVVPITSRVRGHNFEVPLSGTKHIEGVVICQQMRTVDFKSRGMKFAEKAPIEITNEVLRKIRAIVA